MPPTLTVTPEPGHNPPRMVLSLAYTGQASATVVRNDPDGRSWPVRLAEPAVLLDGAWVGYDYESRFGYATTYTATTAGGSITSDPATLDAAQAWLRHPGVPGLSIPVRIHGDDDPVREVNRSVKRPLGRRYPIVVTDGRRRAKTAVLTIRTETLDEADALLAIMDDTAVLLLNTPPAWGWGRDLEHQYVSFGDLKEQRLSTPDDPWRHFIAAYDVVGRPAGGQQAQHTYADVLIEAASYQDLLGLYGSYADLLTGTRA